MMDGHHCSSGQSSVSMTLHHFFPAKDEAIFGKAMIPSKGTIKHYNS